ncbi:MAG: sulfotransferase [Deltaproteobacteria bacterium]|nr:sulfotransferase [Deltaproteobacteria bacterium]MBW2018593.1 sulfotransferase [Deltaproteobacteria bacterium]MBW2073859.1 sulfotransferase [Deltaproteobacteria bacterium]
MTLKSSDFTICILDGIARSGTTFTGAVINSLPDTFFLMDTFKLPQYYQEMHGHCGHPYNISEMAKSSNTDFGKMIPSYSSFEMHCVNPTLARLGDREKEARIKERLRKRANDKPFLSYVRAFELFYETLREEYQVRVVGGKTTFCHAYKNQMLLNIPNLKWIDIIRDVRGVMCSGVTGHYRIGRVGRFDPWREQVNSIKNLSTSIEKGRHLLIKYEDIILKKEETMYKIANFLGIESFDYKEWEKKPILKNDGSLFGTHSSFDESGKPLKEFYFREGKMFDTKPVKRWETFFSKSEKWLLTKVYRQELSFLGYPIKKGFSMNLSIFLSYLRICFWRCLFRLRGIWKKAI